MGSMIATYNLQRVQKEMIGVQEIKQEVTKVVSLVNHCGKSTRYIQFP